LILDTTGLEKEIYPISWLIGEWEGTGLFGGHFGLTNERFVQRASWKNAGKSLYYKSEIRETDLSEKGDFIPGDKVLISEEGSWRVSEERPENLTDKNQFPLKIEITTSWNVDNKLIPVWKTGYDGLVGSGKIQTISEKIDIIKPDFALANNLWRSQRMFGNVNKRVLWVWEVAEHGAIAEEMGLQSIASGGLWKV
jgi:hypothetical protein